MGSHLTSHERRHFLGRQNRLTIRKTEGPEKKHVLLSFHRPIWRGARGSPELIPISMRAPSSTKNGNQFLRAPGSDPVLRKGEEVQPASGKDPGFTALASSF